MQVQVCSAMHAHCNFSLCRPCTLFCSKLHAEAQLVHEAGQAQLGDTQEVHEELLLARYIIIVMVAAPMHHMLHYG